MSVEEPDRAIAILGIYNDELQGVVVKDVFDHAPGLTNRVYLGMKYALRISRSAPESGMSSLEYESRLRFVLTSELGYPEVISHGFTNEGRFYILQKRVPGIVFYKMFHPLQDTRKMATMLDQLHDALSVVHSLPRSKEWSRNVLPTKLFPNPPEELLNPRRFEMAVVRLRNKGAISDRFMKDLLLFHENRRGVLGIVRNGRPLYPDAHIPSTFRSPDVFAKEASIIIPSVAPVGQPFVRQPPTVRWSRFPLMPTGMKPYSYLRQFTMIRILEMS